MKTCSGWGNSLLAQGVARWGKRSAATYYPPTRPSYYNRKEHLKTHFALWIIRHGLQSHRHSKPSTPWALTSAGNKQKSVWSCFQWQNVRNEFHKNRSLLSKAVVCNITGRWQHDSAKMCHRYYRHVWCLKVVFPYCQWDASGIIYVWVEKGGTNKLQLFITDVISRCQATWSSEPIT
jgi:hypothetical protein